MQSRGLFDGRSEAGKLVKVTGLLEHDFEAFCPHPLPPSIELDADLFLALDAARGKLGELAGLGRSISNPGLLINPFIRKEAVLSSKIEGTRTELGDLYRFEAAGIRSDARKREMRDAEEVYNYVEALEHGLRALEDLPMSLRLICELHRELMKGVRGQQQDPGNFRRDQNWIGPRDSRPWEADFVPCPPQFLPDALDSFEKYLHADEGHPPLIRIGLSHYQFEAIHPFRDGNGRVGRLLISLLLVSWGLLPSPLLYLSAYFEKNREEYYTRLMNVSRSSDWKGWLLFFLKGVEEQSQHAVECAKQLQDLRERWRTELTTARGSSLLLRLVDQLFERPVLTVPGAAEHLHVTYRSAQKNIEKLVTAGILERVEGTNYPKIYLAIDVLRAVRS